MDKTDIRSRYNRLIIFVICIAITNQFYIDLYFKGFNIALSVIIIPIMLYIYISDINPLVSVSVAGIFTPAFRGFVKYISNSSLQEVVHIAAPDILFSFSYALVYYFMYYRSRKKDLYRFGLAVFCCDAFSNIIEIYIYAKGSQVDMSIFKGLFLIAAIRTAIVLAIIIMLRYYKTTINREEQEARYRQLVLKTSSFKTEIYFMNKNIAEVEDVMKKSFQVYKQLSDGKLSEAITDMALDIAKDVHEIKKDYIRVIKGLNEFSQKDIDIESMRTGEIAEILEADAREFINREGYNIALNFKVETDVTIRQHFYITSILKNLINNSIEAMGKERGGVIGVNIRKQDGSFILVVTDNGEGISREDIPYIYMPGFSSRFDNDTGEISRGLGLTLVKDLVYNKFGGSVGLKTEKNIGTEFTITIPAGALEGGQ